MKEDKSKIIAKAQEYIQTGGIDSAIDEYKKVLEDDPRDIATLLKIGDLCSRQNRITEAIETYKNVALLYEKENSLLRAVAVYKQILKLDPEDKDREFSLALAKLLKQLNISDEAHKYYQRAHEYYAKIGEHAKAEEIHAQIEELRISQSKNSIGLLLVDEFLKAGYRDEALHELESILEKNKATGPSETLAHALEKYSTLKEPDSKFVKKLCEIYFALGKPKNALAFLKSRFQKDPSNEEILELIAKAFVELKQLEKAKFVYNEVINIYETKGNAEAKKELLRQITHLLHPDGDEPKEKNEKKAMVVPEASDARKMTLEQQKAFVSRLSDRVDIILKYGGTDVAISNLKDAADVIPNNTDVHFKLKSIYEETHNTEGIKSELLVLSDIAEKTGNTDLQKEYLDKVATIDTHDEGLQLRLSKIKEKKSQSLEREAPQEVARVEMQPSKEEISLDLDVLPELQESYELLKQINESTSAPEIILNEIEKSLASEKKPTGLKGELQSIMIEKKGRATKEPETLSYKKELDIDIRTEKIPEEDLHELEFFINHSMFNEANEIMETLLQKYPSNTTIMEFKEKLAREGQKAPLSFVNLQSMLEDKEPGRIPSLKSVISEFNSQVQKTIPENDGETRYNLAIAYQEMELYDMAIDELKRVENSEGMRYKAHCLLGLCYQKKNDTSNALHYYKRAIGEFGIPDEQKIDLYYNLGICSLDTNEEDPISYFKKVFRLNPEYKDLAIYLQKLNISAESLEKESTLLPKEINSKISFI